MIEFQSAFHKPNINQVKNVPQLKVFNKYLGELTTVSKRSDTKPQDVITELRNRLGKVLGSEHFTLTEGYPESIGFLISVEPEYRKKNFRFGEILRLSSIMMILENKIKEFKIISKNTAIFFHSKYKFEPSIKSFETRDKALESVIENCKKGYEDIKHEAERLQEECRHKQDAKEQRELCIKTNLLLKKYFQRVLDLKDNTDSHPFKTAIDMVLTDKAIIENKDFFNNLFKKHSIDYRI